MSENIKFIGIKVKQPLGEFYIGKINGKYLYESSYAEVRNMRDDDIGQRLGIQRELSDTRVKEIKEYVKTVDASFPNSVILSTKVENINGVNEIYNDVYEFEIKNDERTFQIIDGQHRIAGLEDYNETTPFELNVSLFLDMDPEQQAILFSTINIKQAKVNKSLSYELLAIQKIRNPIKTAHYIGRILNNEDGGALNKRISALAIIKKEDNLTITQATFIQQTVKYISGNEKQLIKDRDLLKRDEKLVYADESLRKKIIFRNLFIDERDSEIAIIMSNYFKAVENKWTLAWNDDKYVLKKTIGFNALMTFLRDAYEIIQKYDEIIEIKEFDDFFKCINITDEEWKVDDFQLSGYGQSDIVKKLRESLNGHVGDEE